MILSEEPTLFDLEPPPFIEARSKERFPSLAGPACPWHDDCTPMDCENHRRLPASPWEE